MDLEQAASNYRRANQHSINLVTVHRRAGDGGRGRRIEEVSINRAIVVITVATWQALVQDLTKTCLDQAAPLPGDPFLPTYRVIVGGVQQRIGGFSTPNAQNSRKLLQEVGFDPRPHWTWKQSAGKGRGRITLQPADVEAKMDQWLKVRHAIAHGHEHLPPVQVLQAVRSARSAPTDPSLNLTDAIQCGSFFNRLVTCTGAALAAHLGVTPTTWK